MNPPCPPNSGMDCCECIYTRDSKKFEGKIVCSCPASPARGRMVTRGEFCSHFESNFCDIEPTAGE